MDEELTLQQAAANLGISRQRLAVLAKQGRIGHQVAGRYWVFSTAEIDAFRSHIHGHPGRPRRLPADHAPAPPQQSPRAAPEPSAPAADEDPLSIWLRRADALRGGS